MCGSTYPLFPDCEPVNLAARPIPVGDALSLRVPASAVVVRGQMEMVFLAEDGTARLRLVKTGKRFGDEIEVLSGVAKGERVVSEGASGLTDDQPVSVLQ